MNGEKCGSSLHTDPTNCMPVGSFPSFQCKPLKTRRQISMMSYEFSLIGSCQPLNQIFAGIDAFVLLLSLSSISTRQCLNVSCVVRIAKITINVSIRICFERGKFDSRNTVSRWIGLALLTGRLDNSMDGALDGVVAPPSKQIACVDNHGTFYGRGIDKLPRRALDL